MPQARRKGKFTAGAAVAALRINLSLTTKHAVIAAVCSKKVFLEGAVKERENEREMNRFERMFADWVIKYRLWILVATVLLVVASMGGMQYLKSSSDLRVFFSDKNPQFQALEALENTYSKSDNIFFVIAPKDGNVFTRPTLKAIEELTEASWQIPHSSRVDSVTNFQHTRVQDDDLIVEDLVLDAEGLSQDALAEIKDIAVNEPLLLNRLVSPTGHVTGVNVNIIKPGKSDAEVGEIAAFAFGLLADFKADNPDIDIYLTGMSMYDYNYGKSGKDDIVKLVPIMLVLLLLILGILLRSVLATLSTLVIIIISTFTGIGLAGWLGIQLNVVSMSAPTIILTLAVADSVHLLVTMLQNMRRGMDKLGAIAESLRINFQPIFLTSLTTAIGFLTMNFSDAPPFRDLGNIVALGVTAAFLYSVFFLPAFLAVLPFRVKAGAAGARTAKPIMERFANFIIRNRKRVLAGTVAAVLLLAAGTMKIDLNDDFFKYFDESYSIRRASDFAMENLTALELIDYSLDSGETGGINDPEYLKKIDEFAQWYRAQPSVVHVSTITDIMKRLNMNMNGNDPAYYRIPRSRELAAQYLLLYEISLPFGLDLNNQIDVDKSMTRMRVATSATTARAKRELDKRAQAWLRANAPEEMWTAGSGIAIIFAHISERNINSMLGASFGALVIISGILVIALRSLRLGVISLVPNIAPAFMAFGIWGLMVGQVGLALSTIVSLTLGIVVDFTIHFMSKYQRAHNEMDLSAEDSVRYTFNTVGTAIVISTIVLVVGFTVLAFSGFKLNSDMGQMTALTITLALMLDFLFLPTVLMSLKKKPSAKEIS